MLCGKADAIAKNSPQITAKPFRQSYEKTFANRRKNFSPIVGKNSSQSSEKLIAVGFLIVWLENSLR